MSRHKRTARLHARAEQDLRDRMWAVSSPVDCDDAEAFPNIAQARADLAAMSPEKRAELERGWL